MDIRQTKAHDFARRFVPGSASAVREQATLMKLITYHAFSGLLKSQFVGVSFLETAGLRRLPGSHGDIVGFDVVGKISETDYATLSLTLDEILADHESVAVLLDLAVFAGIEAKALLSDWKVGRRHHDRIRKIAVVGDGPMAMVVATSSAPLYAQAAKRFAPAERQGAWAWVAG